MRIAKTSLFPEDFAMGFLADQTKWNITGKEEIANIDTVVIEGTLHIGYDKRYNAKTFKLNIDPNTGILLQVEAKDALNIVKESIRTKTIEINKTVETKLYNSIQK
ncbi:hypothetical protein P4V01_28535 [Bacillus thuringiensis]|nr:hypothetical protein [Bacillus thuringiensis]